MKTVAIVQARMTSTRLPGKVLLDLAGEPMLARVVARLARGKSLDQVVVATTTDVEDEPIVELCHLRNWQCSRGDREDVLDRYYHAAMGAKADTIVRITSDCPLIDPKLVDCIVEMYRGNQPHVSYVSNTIGERTFPRGLDAEVFSMEALAAAWREDANPAWREHVTPYLYRRPDRFQALAYTQADDHSGYRWTVDTPDDYELVNRIFTHFGHDHFSWLEVLSLMQSRPDWQVLNRHIEQKVH